MVRSFSPRTTTTGPGGTMRSGEAFLPFDEFVGRRWQGTVCLGFVFMRKGLNISRHGADRCAAFHSMGGTGNVRTEEASSAVVGSFSDRHIHTHTIVLSYNSRAFLSHFCLLRSQFSYSSHWRSPSDVIACRCKLTNKCDFPLPIDTHTHTHTCRRWSFWRDTKCLKNYGTAQILISLKYLASKDYLRSILLFTHNCMPLHFNIKYNTFGR